MVVIINITSQTCLENDKRAESTIVQKSEKKNKFLYNVVVYILNFNLLFFFPFSRPQHEFIHLYRQAPAHYKHSSWRLSIEDLKQMPTGTCVTFWFVPPPYKQKIDFAESMFKQLICFALYKRLSKKL